MTNITMLAATRPRLLKQALDSIGDLSEATVAIRDAGGDAEVGGIIRRWCGQHDWKTTGFLSGTDPLGTGPARNEVVWQSAESFGKGSHLYLSDDDVAWLQPDWLSIMVKVYEEAYSHGFRAIGCYNHPFNRPCAPTVRLESRWNVNEVFALASQSMLMDWETWDVFGPFCDTPAGKVCQSEDVAFSLKIREAGYKVGVISPALLVNTGITNSFGEHIPGWELVKSQCPQGVICE